MHCLAFLKGREASQKTSYHKDRPLQSKADSWPPNTNCRVAKLISNPDHA
jgi:hypothetical protein